MKNILLSDIDFNVSSMFVLIFDLHVNNCSVLLLNLFVHLHCGFSNITRLVDMMR